MQNDFKQNKIFCFDIETVPDFDLAKRHIGLDPNTPDDIVYEELTRYHLNITDGKNTFFRQLFWKVLCISYVEASLTYDDNYESYSVISIKSGGRADMDEKSLIQSCFTYLNKERPRIITFNGRGFDVPVLKYRSMMYKIPAPWLYKTGNKWSNYNQRYSQEWHTDLFDVFSDFGTSARINISEVCSLLQIPCKIDMNGSSVMDSFKKGEIDKIRNYCEQDALCTYILYLYLSLHQDRFSELGFKKSIESLENFVSAQKLAHLEDFMSELKI
jgi:predicted PolB exonuclease-like 3'-5' exonuclease